MPQKQYRFGHMHGLSRLELRRNVVLSSMEILAPWSENEGAEAFVEKELALQSWLSRLDLSRW